MPEGVEQCQVHRLGHLGATHWFINHLHLLGERFQQAGQHSHYQLEVVGESDPHGRVPAVGHAVSIALATVNHTTPRGDAKRPLDFVISTGELYRCDPPHRVATIY